MRRRGRPTSVVCLSLTDQDIADAAVVAAAILAVPAERRMNAVATALRVWIEGHLDQERADG